MNGKSGLADWFSRHGRQPEYFGFWPHPVRPGTLTVVAGFGSGHDRHRLGLNIEEEEREQYREYLSSLGAREDDMAIADG